MSPLFHKKKSTEKTILLLDIENGSVGGALVRLAQGEAPKIFSQKRLYMQLLPTRDSHSLSERVASTARSVLSNLAHVAARVRQHPTHGSAGEVSRIIFFLHAPWVMVGVPEPGKVSLDAHDMFLQTLREGAAESFDGIPTSFQSFGSRIPQVVSSIFSAGDDTLLISMTGEVTELSKVRGSTLVGHATIPFGTHTFVRTLQTHGGMSEPEARSALQLLRHHGTTSHVSWGEAFTAAGTHFMTESRDVLGELLSEHVSPHGVYVLAPAPLGEWFAKTIVEDDALAALFPEGSTARAVHPHHTKPFLGAHSSLPDVPLTLETLSVDTRMSGI